MKEKNEEPVEFNIKDLLHDVFGEFTMIDDPFASRRELIHQGICDLTDSYHELAMPTVREALANAAIESRVVLPQARLNYLFKQWGFDVEPSAVEDCADTYQLFHHIGTELIPLYEDFNDWTVEMLQNEKIENPTIIYSGRDSLPFFVASAWHRELAQAQRKYFRLGRRQLDFLANTRFWKTTPDPVAQQMTHILSDTKEYVTVDFATSGSPDRTLHTYMNHLFKRGQLATEPAKLRASLLLFSQHGGNEIDIKKYFGANTVPISVQKQMLGVDAHMRNEVVSYLGSRFEGADTIWKTVRIADILSGTTDKTYRKCQHFLMNLEEIGAGVVENPSDTQYPKNERWVEQSLPAHPLQILVGRLGFLQALKDAQNVPLPRTKKHPAQAINYVYDNFFDGREVILSPLCDHSEAELDLPNVNMTAIRERRKTLQQTLEWKGDEGYNL